MSNTEIAEVLCLTISTIKSHIHRIYTKLRVNSRTKALARAREFQLPLTNAGRLAPVRAGKFVLLID